MTSRERDEALRMNEHDKALDFRSIAVSVTVFIVALIVASLFATNELNTWQGGLWIMITAGPACLVALIVAHVGRAKPRWSRSLAQRSQLGVFLTIAPIVIGGAWAAHKMFVMSADVYVAASVLILAGAVGARASYVLSGGERRDVREIRAGLQRVAEGERDVRFNVTARDELGDLAMQARETVHALDVEERRRGEAERMRRETVASISHDLRTPITSLRLLAEAIEDDLVDAETTKRYAASMRTHVTVLGDLIDDLFELARIEAGALTWSMEQIELGALVDDVVVAMEHEANARGVTIAAAEPECDTLTVGDPARLRRVMFNLLQNAVRHTPADGSVTVRVAQAADGLQVDVDDTGEGIDEADRERIFEPFYRGGSEAARTRPGTGLGLAISRAIVEAHGGRIWVDEADQGTRMRFTVAPRELTAA